MDKKSNIFDSDDESEGSSDNEHFNEGKINKVGDRNSLKEDQLLDSVDQTVDDINITGKQFETEGPDEEEEVFINPISGLPMTAEEAEMELDPITGLPIYEDDLEEIEYLNSILRNKALKSLGEKVSDYKIDDNEPKKKKKVKERKSSNVDLNHYLSDMKILEEESLLKKKEDEQKGKFVSQRMKDKKKELGIKRQEVAKKVYKYELQSILPKPFDITFRSAGNKIISNVGLKMEDDQSFPTLGSS
tara:strand:+ start:1034 stop:1771 length:738 start_codon:yes stop_codon:yes gene_type:complete